MNGRMVGLCLYLTRMELRRRFAGSAGGRLWLLAGTPLSIAVIWLAVGSGVVPDGAFGRRLVAGLAAWLFFAEAVVAASGSITNNPHLVKKVRFPVGLLPLSQVLAALPIHLGVVGCLALGTVVLGAAPGGALLVLPVWILALVVLTGAVGVLCATLNVVSRDVSMAVSAAIALGFWATPVIWPVERVPQAWRAVFLLNPVAVVLEGYRACLVGGETVLTAPSIALFAGVVLALTGSAAAVYRRARPVFGDRL